jgi:serine/threonine protein kinase
MSSSMSIIDYGLVDEEQLPYENPRFLGSGNSGAVVHAVNHRDTKALYAQKKLRISQQPRTNRQEHFLNEVRIIRGLASHIHIVRVHATYLSKLYFGILLEPVASDGDLEAYLVEYTHRRDGNVFPNSVADMEAVLQRGFGCLAAGLAFMHEKKVRHKDIKPRNILVHDGILLFTDFGYSWDSSGLDTSMTNGLASGNTPRFSAPEVLNSKDRDSRSDVFSLGCVFLIVLSALNPALVVDSNQDFAAIIDSIHNLLGSMASSMDLGVLPDVVTRMTDPEASSRLCSAHAACHLLQHSNLCCPQCSSSTNRDWVERGEDDRCAPPTYLLPSATDALSRQVSGPSIAPLVSVSESLRSTPSMTGTGSERNEQSTRHKINSGALSATSSQQTREPPGTIAVENVGLGGRNDRLRPESAVSESSTTVVPGRTSSGYKARTGAEAAEFFRQGRVFSVLQSEVVSSRSFPRDTVSVDRGLHPSWGAQELQSVARRFVVVKSSKKQQCSYAWLVSIAILARTRLANFS